jgi:hypothetical protein
MARRWLFLSAESKRDILDAQKSAEVIQQPAGKLAPDEVQRGWGQPVFDFYGSFLRFLRDQTFSFIQTPVYAVGYDWRQSNEDSGKFVADKIEKILTDELADRVIIVSHSMGGLVTRSALQRNAGLASKLLGIIHVMQPVAGAAVFYRRMYTGNISPQDDPGFLGISGLNIILGNNAEKFATLVSVLRGPTELMPTPNYTDGISSNWIHFFIGPFLPQHLGVRASDWFPYQGSLTHPPGLLDLSTIDSRVATDMHSRVLEAKNFHDGLGLFKHANTWAIFSTKVLTDIAFTMDENDVLDIDGGRAARGDGTVPASSASILFPGQKHKLDDLCNGDPRQFVVENIQHADGMGATEIQALVKAIIEKILSLRCFEPAPAIPSQPGDGGTKTFEETIKEIVGETEEEVRKDLDKDFNV